MKKSFWIGLVFLLVIIGGVLVWRFATPSGSRATPGAIAAIPGTEKLPAAKVEPLKITGIGGYALSSVDLGDGP
ncbi:MAG: hypothetical protein Q8O15_09750, partial [Rectinemataceae bacterium]|nr:hypothetical protein [Rectinemataceae bacterium]